MLLCFLPAVLAQAQVALPKKDANDRIGFEPSLMLDGPNAPILSGTVALSPDERVTKCQDDLVRAEQRAADAEQLYKEGILAKVEAEARVLSVVQAKKSLADAQQIAATAHQMDVAKSFGARTATQADLDAANAALKAATAAAASSDAAWKQAELNAALLDEQRKRTLYKEGVGSAHDLQVAEDRAALLSGTTGP